MYPGAMPSFDPWEPFRDLRFAGTRDVPGQGPLEGGTSELWRGCALAGLGRHGARHLGHGGGGRWRGFLGDPVAAHPIALTAQGAQQQDGPGQEEGAPCGGARTNGGSGWFLQGGFLVDTPGYRTLRPRGRSNL